MWWRRPRWRAVAKVGDVEPNCVIAVSAEGLELVLGRDGDRYFAVQRWCVHRGADLSQGFIARNQLVCPQHGWRFSTETGREGGIWDACLQVHDVRIVAEQIEINLVPKKQRA